MTVLLRALAAVLCVVAFVARSEEEGSVSDYRILSPMSLEQSLRSISGVPVHYFFDEVKGGFRVGVLGDKIAASHPEFVQMVEKKVLVDAPAGGKSGPSLVSLGPKPTVDTTLVFTHVMAVAQLLGQRATDLKNELARFDGGKALQQVAIMDADLDDTVFQALNSTAIRIGRDLREKPRDMSMAHGTVKLWQEVEQLRIKTLEAESAAILEARSYLREQRIGLQRVHHERLVNLSIALHATKVDLMLINHDGMNDSKNPNDSVQDASEYRVLVAEYENQKEVLQSEYDVEIRLIKERYAEIARLERLNEPTAQKLIETESKLALAETSQLVDTIFVEIGSLLSSIVSSKETVLKLSASVFGFIFFLAIALEIAPALRAVWGTICRKDILNIQHKSIPRSATAAVNSLDEMSLQAEMKETLSGIAINLKTAARLKTRLPFVLFHGAPGTGKTLAAKCIAEESGLSFAALCGADLQALGMKAGLYLRQLLDAAEKRSAPTIVVIDEADSIIATRDEVSASKSMANSCLYTLLQSMRQGTSKLAVFITTRRPLSGIDAAILDRLDRVVHFTTPAAQIRLQFALQQIPVKLCPFLSAQVLGDFELAKSDAELQSLVLAQFNEDFAGRTSLSPEQQQQRQPSAPETDLPVHATSAQIESRQIEKILKKRLAEEEAMGGAFSVSRSLTSFLLASSQWSFRDLDKVLSSAALSGATSQNLTPQSWLAVLLRKSKEERHLFVSSDG